MWILYYVKNKNFERNSRGQWKPKKRRIFKNKESKNTKDTFTSFNNVLAFRAEEEEEKFHGVSQSEEQFAKEAITSRSFPGS